VDPYREYQDYVMASRLLVALGLSREVLSLSHYARLRLLRMELARKGDWRALEGLAQRLLDQPLKASGLPKEGPRRPLPGLARGL